MRAIENKHKVNTQAGDDSYKFARFEGNWILGRMNENYKWNKNSGGFGIGDFCQYETQIAP